MGHDIFISYAAEDKGVADAICDTLESRGLKCWVAPRNISLGADWGTAIVRAISESRLMVLIFSSSANQSQQVMREVNLAIDKRVTITPFRIEDVMPSDAMEYYLDVVHWLDALTPPLEKHINKLADEVKSMFKPPIIKLPDESQPSTIPGDQDKPEESTAPEKRSHDVVESSSARSNGIAVRVKSTYLADVRQRLLANGFECQENVQFNGQTFALVSTDKSSLLKLNWSAIFLFSEFPFLTIERLEEFSDLCRDYLDETIGGSFFSTLYSRKFNFVVPVAIAQTVDESTLYTLRTKKDFISSPVTKKYGFIFPVIYSVQTGTLNYFEGYTVLSVANVYLCREKVKKLLGSDSEPQIASNSRTTNST